MNYNWKITLMLIAVLFVTALLTLAAITVSAGRTIKEKSAELTMQRLDSMKHTVETTLLDFEDMATYIISDYRVQEYLRTGEAQAGNFTQLTNNAYHLLTYLINSSSYVDYVSIYKNLDDTILYQGETWTVPDFKERMKDGYARSGGTRYGTMVFRTEYSFFNADRYSMNIYQPIQNHYSIGEELGALLISINHRSFSEIYTSGQEESIHFYITDAQGVIVSAADETLIGQSSPIAGHTAGAGGSLEADDNLLIYSRLDQWGWYVVGSISMDDLLRDNRETMRWMVLIISLICAVCALVAYRMSNALYRPLRELTEKMAAVSGGDLSTRMQDKNRGTDIAILAGGFNNMLDEIEHLMERVKEEQRQIEQIKYSALQSQIQPHFLYNTLDCIHWQAAVEGNREVSTMVKALATYYRLCLSKGQDIIPLSQEIAHVKSYLIIQNMRYDGIIEADFAVDEALGGVPIPKMTLQPLVENAIYHGIKIKAGRTGLLSIRAVEWKDHVIVVVEDSGVGMQQARIDEINQSLSVHDDSFGYGVRNVHKRIELLFGKGYGLFYRRGTDGGVLVEINLPKNEQ